MAREGRPMTDDELRKLAEAALKDRAACSDGNWEPHWDGTLGRSSVFVKPPEGGPCLAQVIVMRRGFGGIAPEGYWIAAARTREPELARAVLRLLSEVERLDGVAKGLAGSHAAIRTERDALAHYKAEAVALLAKLASGPHGIIFAALTDEIERRITRRKSDDPCPEHEA